MMKIATVIEKVDAWQPNVFSDEEKLYWCYECSMNILNECPVYKTHEVTVGKDGGIVPLPLDVKVSDLAAVYVNGRKIVVANSTVYNDMSFKRGDKVALVYRVYPDEYVINEDGSVPDEYETVCQAPFESMYIDYVCAQIAYQQNDAAEFNKFIGSFNDKFTAYKEMYGAMSPASVSKEFFNFF